MKQSAFPHTSSRGLHVAIVTDDDHHKAQPWGLRQYWGHPRGSSFVLSLVETAMSFGIDTLTLCSLSSDNWECSATGTDIAPSMKRFLDNLHAELAAPPDSDICIQVIGRRDRFPPQVLDRIEKLQDVGKGTHGLTLRLAFDYSGRQMLIEALRHAAVNIPLDKSGHPTLGSFLGQAMNTGQSSPDVDLMIRTGGEYWLGDSLLWESAYAELFFTPKKWPDFTDKDLAEAIREFHGRERRFGNIVLAS